MRFINIQFLLLLCLLTSPLALADLGHKPTMEFQFKQGMSQTVTAVSGVLLESQKPDGSKATPLSQLGPQRFECKDGRCFAMAYTFAPYHRLSLTFSDGKTRLSNVFATAGIDSKYTILVRDGDLLVTTTGKLGTPKQPNK